MKYFDKSVIKNKNRKKIFIPDSITNKNLKRNSWGCDKN